MSLQYYLYRLNNENNIEENHQFYGFYNCMTLISAVYKIEIENIFIRLDFETIYNNTDEEEPLDLNIINDYKEKIDKNKELLKDFDEKLKSISVYELNEYLQKEKDDLDFDMFLIDNCKELIKLILDGNIILWTA